MTVTSEMLNVLFCIPEGKENAVPRTELCASVGYSDRLTRKIIAQLREEGYIICNFGNGYYISSDLDEIEIADYAYDALWQCYMNPSYVTSCNGMECPAEYVYAENTDCGVIYVW